MILPNTALSTQKSQKVINHRPPNPMYSIKDFQTIVSLDTFIESCTDSLRQKLFT